MVKYSFIVPVYKVEKYLGECINSILGQKPKSFEVILVDDGSPDRCPKICDDYARENSSIRVIHQKNGGLSAARNTGIRAAKGEYILFVDPDDYLEKEYLETIEKNIDDSDLLVFGYYDLYKNKRIKKTYSNLLANKEQALECLLSDDGFCGYAWNKVYKKSVLDKLKLYYDEEVEMCEDVLFSYEYIKNIDKVKIVDAALINYRQRKSSIVSKRIKNINAKSLFDTYKYIIDDADNQQIIDKSKALYLKYYYKYKNHTDEKVIDKKLIEKIRKEDYRHFSKSDKKLILMFKYMPIFRPIIYGLKGLIYKKYE